MSSLKEKIKNAYLLFYDRIEPYDEEVNNSIIKTETHKKEEESKEENLILKGDKKLNEKAKVKEEEEDESMADHTKGQVIEPSTAIPEEFLKNLRENNQKFQIHKNVFSKEKEYFDFILELFFQRNFTPNFTYNENLYQISVKPHPKEYHDFNLIKMTIIVLLTTILREKSRYGIVRLLPIIKKIISQVNFIPAKSYIHSIFLEYSSMSMDSRSFYF